VPPVLGRKYTAPLNILNDLSKEERVCTLDFHYPLNTVLNDQLRSLC